MIRQSSLLPLLGSGLTGTGMESVIAWRRGRPITRARFLADVLGIADRLPDHAHVINVCDDRYLFMVGFAAAVVRGQVNLLPSSRVPGVVLAIAAEYPDTYLLGDAPLGDGALPQFRIALDTDMQIETAAASAPDIPGEQLAAILFTSGSTGQAAPHRKTWQALVRGAATNARALLPAGSGQVTVVATVPSQHMYGFETTILLPLQGHCAVQCERPLYPADVCRALAETPAPRVLITTPVHLRALAEYSGTLPPLSCVICATAPLTQKLAAACEEKLGAPIEEAFGCTEAGIMATRRTIHDEPWQLLDLFTVEAAPDRTFVRAQHLPETIVMQDVIELADPRRFRLIGRGADLVNIAGKRASLGDLNAKLLSIEGVQDGVIFLPDRGPEGDADGAIVRTAALVVAPGLTREAVMAALRQVIDPAFLPRPLFLVDALPRSESSKLPRAALLKLYAEQMRG